MTAVRRGGGVGAFHQITTYYNLSEMIIPPSQYWVIGYGREKGEIRQDAEGEQAIRRNANANAMAWLLKMKELTKDSVALPREENFIRMNFIR